MINCPDCGRELPTPESECPSCKQKIKKTFTIRQFLWDNFRFFTMIGITGTMISLIPNMGTRILGTTWITDTDSLLPLFLSIIIFFGSLFLTICFLIIFYLVIQNRENENIRTKITLAARTLLTWYEGDTQRFILLFCLVPMWFGLTLFFILLMPLIPNKYSWLFAAITGLTCIPLALYAFFGWHVGKKVSQNIPGMEKNPRMVTAVFAIVVIAFLVLLPFAIPRYFNNTDTFSGDIKIKPDQQYFSPHISSAKGLRLDITNLSGRELLDSRRTWSASYGYFIWVIPATSDIEILGNPVYDYNKPAIYWTWAGTGTSPDKKPVKIDMHLYPSPGKDEITSSSIYLTWYNNDIVYVNTSFAPVP